MCCRATSLPEPAPHSAVNAALQRGSATAQAIAELGATIERRLLALLFETELGPITQRYAVF